MSTTARDKATSDALAQFQLGGQYVGSREADALLYGAGYGFDAGRASVLSSLTVERIAETLAKAEDADYWVDEIADWEDGEVWEREAHPDNYPSSAYEDRDYYLSVARAVLALIEQET